MPVATAGYLNATLKSTDSLDMNVKADYLVVSTRFNKCNEFSDTGNKVFNTGIKVIGISVSRSAEECKDRIMEELERILRITGAM